MTDFFLIVAAIALLGATLFTALLLLMNSLRSPGTEFEARADLWLREGHWHDGRMGWF